jgi:hypothetical protein
MPLAVTKINSATTSHKSPTTHPVGCETSWWRATDKLRRKIPLPLAAEIDK